MQILDAINSALCQLAFCCACCCAEDSGSHICACRFKTLSPLYLTLCTMWHLTCAALLRCTAGATQGPDGTHTRFQLRFLLCMLVCRGVSILFLLLLPRDTRFRTSDLASRGTSTSLFFAAEEMGGLMARTLEAIGWRTSADVAQAAQPASQVCTACQCLS